MYQPLKKTTETTQVYLVTVPNLIISLRRLLLKMYNIEASNSEIKTFIKLLNKDNIYFNNEIKKFVYRSKFNYPLEKINYVQK
jgi:hypothetical protein